MLIFTVNLRLSLAYIALFAGIGLHLPFFPLWLAERGLDASERAVVLALPMFIRVVALSFLIEWGLASGTPARAMLIYSVLAALLTALLPFQPTLLGLAAIAIISNLIWMPVLPLLDAVAMREMRQGRADYGRARLWGSVAFVVMAMAGGTAIEIYGVALVIPLLVVILLILGLSALGLPREGVVKTSQGTAASIAAILDQSRPVWRLFAAGALLQASHAVFYVQGSVHWKQLGYSETLIGGLWMIAILAEIVLFFRSKRLVARFDAKTLLMMASLAAFMRWTLMAFDPPGFTLVFLQCLHALTFAVTHIATTWMIAQMFSGALAARAQGLYVSLLGAANGVTMLAAGPIYAQFAGASQMAMAGIALIAFVLVIWRAPPPATSTPG